MDENEWLTGENPAAMLRLYRSDEMPWPRGTDAPIVSQRKLRLFACAIARLTPKPSAASLDAAALAEKIADDETPLSLANGMEWNVLQRDAVHAAAYMLDYVASLHVAEWRPSPSRIAAIFRDIIGNPYRPVKLPSGPCAKCGKAITTGNQRIHRPGPCPWVTTVVLGLARAAYEDRLGDWTMDPLTLAALADAMEEAGCCVGRVHEFNNGGIAYWWNDAFPEEHHLTPDRAANHPVLAHLRGGGQHTRGCWALDLILGKG